mmetsp:Transcript_33109/g.63984  ORF Transcript_33109/g.63984 Transcript_33109/m.63984 type:complete len:148 (-) Transcript_33109:414-857(-)
MTDNLNMYTHTERVKTTDKCDIPHHMPDDEVGSTRASIMARLIYVESNGGLSKFWRLLPPMHIPFERYTQQTRASTADSRFLYVLSPKTPFAVGFFFQRRFEGIVDALQDRIEISLLHQITLASAEKFSNKMPPLGYRQRQCFLIRG